jgi:hypothetical protein
MVGPVPPGVNSHIACVDWTTEELLACSGSQERWHRQKCQDRPEELSVHQAEQRDDENDLYNQSAGGHPPVQSKASTTVEKKQTITSVRMNTKRLILRPFYSSDAIMLYSQLSNPKTHRYSLFGLSSISEARRFIDWTTIRDLQAGQHTLHQGA